MHILSGIYIHVWLVAEHKLNCLEFRQQHGADGDDVCVGKGDQGRAGTTVPHESFVGQDQLGVVVKYQDHVVQLFEIASKGFRKVTVIAARVKHNWTVCKFIFECFTIS